jgi:4-amino-4-deoxy-L-arabinose transferase-like glycosyltransferase
MTGEIRTPSPLQRHIFGPAGLALLIGLYLLTGLIGHDPWRGDDARYFGPIFEMLRGEHLLFPSIGGQPSTDFPPLYYWTGALLARLASPFLPLHDGARLATTLYTALAIFWIARAAGRLYGRQTRTPAALLTLGTLGLVLHAHETQPMIALISMQAMTLAGLSLVPARPALGSLQAGAGATLAFLAGGAPGVIMTIPLFLIVVTASPECRNPRASGGLILGLSVAIVTSALWPLVLHYQAQELLELWWRNEWLDLLSDPLGAADIGRFAKAFSWFAWPLWPLALWSLWRMRRRLLSIPALLPICELALVLLWIVLNGNVSPTALLPLIPPLALLAAGGVPSLRRGAANAFDWFAVMTFGVFAVLAWIAWSAQVFAWPPGLARHLTRVAPDFTLRDPSVTALAGGAITLLWILLVWRLPRSSDRAPANWAIGMTMLWCLMIALLKPWFEHDRSYRPLANSLAIALSGERPGCVAGLNVTPSQRASLHYFADLEIERVSGNATACGFLLVVDDHSSSGVRPTAEWQQIWEYRRGGGKQLETFRLYRREPDTGISRLE